MSRAAAKHRKSRAQIAGRTFGSVVCKLQAAIRSSVLLVCCLLLAACRVPGAVQPTIKIGLVAPFEGRYRYVGYDLFPAVRLALREANAAGGVEGFFVELVAYDDGADPAMALEQAYKLAIDPDVIAVIGHFRERTTLAALPAYAQAGLPLVAPAALGPELEAGDGVVLRPGPDATTLAAALLNGVETAALVSDGGPLGQALQETAGERLGLVVSPADADWVEAVLAAEPPTVVCATDPVTAGEVVVALRSAGWQGTFVGGPELAAGDFSAVAGAAAEGAEFVTPWPLPLDTPEGAAFAAAYEQISGGPPPGPLALPAYEATVQVLEALRADVASHGTPSRAGMAAALASLFEGHYNGDGQLTRYRVGAGGAPEAVSPTAP
jgi:ABC-type branched-subunit amino acid transport system substrate-binding protein